MRTVGRWIALAFRRFWKKPSVWILAGIALALSVWSGSRGSFSAQDKLVVAVHFEEEDGVGTIAPNESDRDTELWRANLQSYEGLFRFEEVHSELELREKLEGEAIIGYAVPVDWKARFLNGEKGIVTRFGGEEGILTQVADEVFFSHALERFAVLTLERTLEEKALIPDGEAEEHLGQGKAWSKSELELTYQESKQGTFHFAIDDYLQKSTWKGTSHVFPVRGVLVLVWILWMLLAMLDAKLLQASGHLDRMTRLQQSLVTVAFVAVAGLCGWVLLELGVWISGGLQAWPKEFEAGVVLYLSLVLIVCALGVSMRRAETVAQGIAIGFLFVLITAPVWFDLKAIAPQLTEVLQVVPWHAYLSAF